MKLPESSATSTMDEIFRTEHPHPSGMPQKGRWHVSDFGIADYEEGIDDIRAEKAADRKDKWDREALSAQLYGNREAWFHFGEKILPEHIFAGVKRAIGDLDMHLLDRGEEHDAELKATLTDLFMQDLLSGKAYSPEPSKRRFEYPALSIKKGEEALTFHVRFGHLLLDRKNGTWNHVNNEGSVEPSIVTFFGIRAGGL